MIAWNEREDGSGWIPVVIHEFGAAVWRVSWSTNGTVVSVSDASRAVTLWKEVVDGRWQQVGSG